jgi:hypothetical protein
VAARFKAWVCRRALDRNAGSIAAGGMDVFSLVCAVNVEISATGISLVQRSPTECGVLGVIVKPR